MNWVPGSHKSTFGGNPVSYQTAFSPIKLLEDGFVGNAAKQDTYLMQESKKLVRTYPIVSDVRGARTYACR
ncbi:Acetylornithine aminotransferase [Candidatus Brocadiaceae bacterium B188]|nr:aminotransferase class III-fold pyridoxal phosphate-dependent enzyme [Candidatus Brocadia sapporoensis]QQR66256.1 MAG: aminotransferase class III-fold pyridoxal phosphate-dependent enzyme [Candidatus Brocadia sp.]RZV57408.1 MAG: aminotransferase class III-fold pyridoxal phosphate-dependent enzyme [Candidatus Brocadia sp. BROELEC01]TWU53209.1 Acetylornithine aminotransferase [Candidatus Brocadiaceae bacterium B188]